jgi:hypothetical protein
LIFEFDGNKSATIGEVSIRGDIDWVASGDPDID